MNYSEDIEETKKQAEKAIKDVALTKDYPLDKKEACRLLNTALATEIVCVLRYRHHQIIAKGINRISIAGEFKEHAEEEEKHMLMIAERINQLGGNPDFHPKSVIQYSITEYGVGNDLTSLIKEDLIAERIVITHYRNLIGWFGISDPTTRRMLEIILADEENHANDLADLLNE